MVIDKIRELLDQLKSLDLELWKNIQHFYFVQETAEEVEYDCDEYGHKETLTVPDEWLEYIICGEIVRAISKKWVLNEFTMFKNGCDYSVTFSAFNKDSQGYGESYAEAYLNAYLMILKFEDK